MARRFFIFSIGFLMGCVLVYVNFFKDSERDFYGSWLPDGRVLKKIGQSIDQSSVRYKCYLNESGVFYTEMEELYKEGNIDFEKSQTDGDIKTYHAYITTSEDREIVVNFSLQQDSAWINQLGIGELQTFECN